MSVRRELPFCLPVRPAVLVAAARGAIGRSDAAAVETARAIRDHRDDLAPDVVSALIVIVTAAAQRDVFLWRPVLAELRRPSLSERARTRAARAERAAQR